MTSNANNIVNSDYLENIKQEIRWQWDIDELNFIEILQECFNDNKNNNNNNKTK